MTNRTKDLSKSAPATRPAGAPKPDAIRQAAVIRLKSNIKAGAVSCFHRCRSCVISG